MLNREIIQIERRKVWTVLFVYLPNDVISTNPLKVNLYNEDMQQ